MFNPLTYYSDGHNGWGSATLKPAARSYLQVSHVDSRDLSTLVILCCFSRQLAGNWLGSGVAKAQSGNHKGCQHCRRQLYSLAQYSSPILFLKYFKSKIAGVDVGTLGF